ncbi:MAG: histidine kinase dimerization/phospho-acceptor domain-containing protein, partial [Actinomycetota bacterium]
MTTLDRTLTEYRLRTVRIGVLATVFVLVALLAYVLFPGEDEIRQTPALILMGIGLAGAGLVAGLPWRRLFERGVGLHFMYAWSVLDIVLVTLLISTAGDSHMEMFLLYAFTTLFFAASYPIEGQVGLLVFTAACYLILMAVQGWPIEPPDLIARLGLLVILSWMASFLSRELIGGMVSSADVGEESDRRAGLLAVVADAARAVSTLDSERVLAAVVQASTALGFEASNLAVFDRERRTYRVVHPVGLPAEYASNDHPIYGGMPGLVFDREDTIMLDDYRGHPRAVPSLAAEGFRAVIATPVYVQGEIAAALVGGTRAARQLLDEDLEAFELLAALAGRALENAQRFETQQRTNERLAELDRMKSDFLSNVSHELRTPLTAIKGMGTTLDQLWDRIDDADRRELLSRLNANAVSLHQIITTLLD